MPRIITVFWRDIPTQVIAEDGKGRDRKQIKLVGEIPKVTSIPQGCLFQSRCPNSNNEKKENVERVLVEVGENHFVDQCGASCE